LIACSDSSTRSKFAAIKTPPKYQRVADMIFVLSRVIGTGPLKVLEWKKTIISGGRQKIFPVLMI
jgi:hypothetical protein